MREDRPRSRRPSAPAVPPREESNPLCRGCLRGCRQPASVVLIDCPRYLRRPFDVPAPPRTQLDLFTSPKKPH